jgi:Dyp-type peroxidase family
MPGILSAASLPNIQGNILTPFKKERLLFIFAQFRDAERASNWLADTVADPALASAQRMLDEPTRPMWFAVAFTFSGLVNLDPSLDSKLQDFAAFRAGAAAPRDYGDGGPTRSAALVGDPEASDPARWLVGSPEASPVDVVLTIAADDDDLLAEAAQEQQTRAAKHGLHVLTLDQGRDKMTQGQFAGRLEHGIDHFGFRDGISQPGVRGFTPEVIRHRRLEVADQPGSPIIASGEFVLGYDAEPRFYPVPDRPGRPTPPDWMHDGSFQVLLRLIQDVHKWRERAARLGSVAGIVNVSESAIGRTTGGRPLATLCHGGFGGDNDFTFVADPEGATTPLGAHIRNMNPRDDDVFHDRQHRLLRRGVPFGPPLSEAAPNDHVVRGMMFNAFMASIEDQFEYVQRHWANPFTSTLPSLQIPAGSTEPDALIGIGTNVRVQQRPGYLVDVPFTPLVHTSGAAYLFAPSLPALRQLGSAQRISVE